MWEASVKTVIDVCLDLKSDEDLLIITDTGTSPRIGDSLLEYAHSKGNRAVLLRMKELEYNGKEPSDIVKNAMLEADAIIAATRRSLTHTNARIDACKNGARIISMPGITEDMFGSGGMKADYIRLDRTIRDLKSRFADASEIRVLTGSGCDLSIDLRGCEWHVDSGICHEAGIGVNLPAGELFLAPANVEGTAVLDGTIAGLEDEDTLLEVEIKDRMAVQITGKGSEKFKELLDRAGRNAYNIAEFAIGMNPEARLIGNILEDEKVWGTVHIAFGTNTAFGGDVDAGIHLDCIIKDPEIYVDGKKWDWW
ncbi:MAG: Leucyl aminopeptidase (aminopeptidase T) [Candidatus Syntrophoarchaeum caldarius]|uniref:Leucyl aminopeptidase (Aminopeptidase T) n=1 Tax=Candidatus Syntropharchaeum caldarium TaxID=1838285 RepID=A0A1F2P8V8_9EURY|nr:MAG: Leucyl aminopeptidase (aminopeptidase T) [Candidatus Syntrophoarchaeum caldarius]